MMLSSLMCVISPRDDGGGDEGNRALHLLPFLISPGIFKRFFYFQVRILTNSKEIDMIEKVSIEVLSNGRISDFGSGN